MKSIIHLICWVQWHYYWRKYKRRPLLVPRHPTPIYGDKPNQTGKMYPGALTTEAYIKNARGNLLPELWDADITAAFKAQLNKKKKDNG